jgi:hypothetical protein
MAFGRRPRRAKSTCSPRKRSARRRQKKKKKELKAEYDRSYYAQAKNKDRQRKRDAKPATKARKRAKYAKDRLLWGATDTDTDRAALLASLLSS